MKLWNGFLEGYWRQIASQDTLQHLLKKLRNPGPSAPPTRLIPEPTERGTTESFDGTRIYWELHGPRPTADGPTPILFCYGLVCSMSQWRMQLDRYRGERPCLLFDYRGHHESAFPENPKLLNLGALAKDGAAVLKHWKLERPVHVWGHSLGVNVALELAAAEPNLVRSLTLIAGTVKSPFEGMFGTDILQDFIAGGLDTYPDRVEMFHLLWKVLAHPPALHAGSRVLGFNMDASTLHDVDTYTQSVVSMDPRTFFLLMRDFSKGMTEKLLPKIKTPGLVIAGARDPLTPASGARAFAAKMPHGHYVEIPAGSHNVQLDFGEYVALKVEEFWREQKLDV